MCWPISQQVCICSSLDWSRIWPAIFRALFILKALRPLFLVNLRTLRSEGSDMRSPDIGGAIGPDVFIGRPEGLAIGWIEHYCAVITYPKRYEEKAETRSGGPCSEIAVALFRLFFPLLLASLVDGYHNQQVLL